MSKKSLAKHKQRIQKQKLLKKSFNIILNVAKSLRR